MTKSKRHKAAQIVMPFGKHKGKQLSQLPRPYLRWLSKTKIKDLSLRRAVEITLKSTRRKKSKNRKRCIRAVCRDCRRYGQVPRIEWLHAAPPRCTHCGGLMDKTWSQKATSSPS